MDAERRKELEADLDYARRAAHAPERVDVYDLLTYCNRLNDVLRELLAERGRDRG